MPGRLFGLNVLAKNRGQFVIYIYNQSEFHKIHREIFIHQSMEVNIVLSKVITSKLSLPYGDCKREYIFKPKLFDKIIKKSYPYFHSQCHFSCRYQEEMKICNKSAEFDAYFQYYYTNQEFFFSEFYYKEIYNCRQKNPSLLDSINLKFAALGADTICEKQCPRQCEVVSYSHTFSNYYVPYINYTRINIFFQEFYFTSITEEPKTTSSSLIGNIGGLFGFFLGGSLMSLFEIFQMPFSLLSIIFKHKKKKINPESKIFYITNKDGSIVKNDHKKLDISKNSVKNIN